jgi:hypothetical protein
MLLALTYLLRVDSRLILAPATPELTGRAVLRMTRGLCSTLRAAISRRELGERLFLMNRNSSQ